jgi:small subunit ribosomal protein S4
MSRFQAKYKLDRRVGKNILQRAKSPVIKRTNKPGMKPSTSTMTPSVSHYGQCLMQRQMCKRIYCVFKESQFSRIVHQAKQSKNVIEALVELLDFRLITVVYRSLFAATPWAARQLVSHKHIKLNGKVINLGNHKVEIGDVIEVDERFMSNEHIQQSLNTRERVVPDFLKVEGNKITVVGKSNVNNPYNRDLNFQMIIEGYR